MHTGRISQVIVDHKSYVVEQEIGDKEPEDRRKPEGIRDCANCHYWKICESDQQPTDTEIDIYEVSGSLWCLPDAGYKEWSCLGRQSSAVRRADVAGRVT